MLASEATLPAAFWAVFALADSFSADFRLSFAEPAFHYSKSVQ